MPEAHDNAARFSPQAVAVIIRQRLNLPPERPHRHTVRYWILNRLTIGIDYVRCGSHILVRKSGVEKIMERME